MKLSLIHNRVNIKLGFLVRSSSHDELIISCRRTYKGVDEVRNTRHLEVESV